MRALTDKERAEMTRLDRKIMSGRKVSRKDILRAFDLKYRARSQESKNLEEHEIPVAYAGTEELET